MQFDLHTRIDPSLLGALGLEADLNCEQIGRLSIFERELNAWIDGIAEKEVEA